jgi:hypothetical protein
MGPVNPPDLELAMWRIASRVQECQERRESRSVMASARMSLQRRIYFTFILRGSPFVVLARKALTCDGIRPRPPPGVATRLGRTPDFRSGGRPRVE